MPSESVPDTPSEICLTPKEWEEIGDCSLALYAAIHCCDGLGGDEPAEMVKSVQMRFAQAVHKVELRIFGE